MAGDCGYVVEDITASSTTLAAAAWGLQVRMNTVKQAMRSKRPSGAVVVRAETTPDATGSASSSNRFTWGKKDHIQRVVVSLGVEHGRRKVACRDLRQKF